jgi:flavin reductase (DIM6/NTAB) family NADH-FMN oxidoreductase RutF
LDIDIEALGPRERYKLMAGLIVPRPIALVTTVSEGGVMNAAPFSMFNMLGEDPPLVMVSINRRDDDSRKDTAANIRRTGEFVVHMTDEPMAHKMHRCGDVLPSNVSELTHAGLNSVPSRSVAPVRIVEAPVAMECTIYETLETASREIFLGQVRWLHVREGLVDDGTWRVNLHVYLPIARMGGWSYASTRERFEMR